jgi:hypothetical protein
VKPAVPAHSAILATTTSPGSQKTIV